MLFQMLQAGVIFPDIVSGKVGKEEIKAEPEIVHLEMSARTEKIVDAQRGVEKKFKKGFHPSLCTQVQR